MLKIKRNFTDNTLIENCVNNSSEGMVYHLPGYARFLSSAVGGEERILSVWNDSDLLGFMRYYRKYHPQYGTVYNSSPWFGSHGGCVIADGAGEEIRDILIKSFAEDMQQEQELLFASISLSPSEYWHQEIYFANLQDCTLEPRTAQILELPQQSDNVEEQVFSIMQSKTRNLVRKSLKQGFTRRIANDEKAWSFLLSTHKENMRAIGGTPKSEQHFKALRNELSNSSQLSLALSDGEPVAALLLLKHKGWVEYFIPVIKHEFRPRQPMSFLIFHALCESVREGKNKWNFGGTHAKQKSLHHFKAGWGALSHPYGYIISATSKGKDVLRSNESIFEAFKGYYLFPVRQ
ncbi:GNAT family N-acetyltransferase [Maridesulfovibrio sp.]|uniref:GNAT family N-acetyltransferase n=1 Tax=Maridesulfovibrio sp. TaxID=2795000 RepID=UPI0029CA9F7F|nr:GNAT family N-acetyltransferase [Maridesulfovibrio sp.]